MIDIQVDGRYKLMPTGKHTMTNEDYHADKHYFSSSQIKHALTSPAHFKHFVLDKNSKQKSTSAMELGTLIHTVVLEPHTFDDNYIVYDGDTNADGSVPRASARLLENKHPLHKVVSKKWYETACKARMNIESYPAANNLIYSKDAEYEPSYFAECPDTGLKLRVRPDMIDLGNGVIVDLKTTSAKSKYEFMKDATYNYHYDLSAYMYLYVVYLLTGKQCDFYFFTVGKEDFVPVAVYKASNTFLEAGKSKFFKAIENIKTALTLPENYRFQDDIEEI
jgi:exodeoxyribonuclease VIII